MHCFPMKFIMLRIYKTLNGTNDIDSLVVVCILRQRSILLEYNYPEIMITDTCIKLLSYFFCW